MHSIIILCSIGGKDFLRADRHAFWSYVLDKILRNPEKNLQTSLSGIKISTDLYNN